MTVAVVTDSTADLSADWLSRHGVSMVPLTVTFNGRSYQDRVELDPLDFLGKLPDLSEPPKTSAPAPGAFVRVYTECLNQGKDGILSIHLAQGLSGTVRCAEVAARMVDGPIRVIDGESASLGTGLLVWWASCRAALGLDLETLADEVQQLKEKLFALTAPVTLEYLARGGRIGQAARLLGTLLDMKPVLVLEHGTFRPERKVRGERQIVPALLASLKSRIEPGRPILAAMGHSGNTQALKEAVAEGWRVVGWLDGVIGPVISSHIGPGAYGLIALPLNDVQCKDIEEVLG